MKPVAAHIARVLVFALAIALFAGPASRFGFQCADVAVAEMTPFGVQTRDCCTPQAACAALCQAVPSAVQVALGEPAPFDAAFEPASTVSPAGLDADLQPPPPRSNAV